VGGGGEAKNTEKKKYGKKKNTEKNTEKKNINHLCGRAHPARQANVAHPLSAVAQGRGEQRGGARRNDGRAAKSSAPRSIYAN